MAGEVASRFIAIDFVSVPPELVAEQLRVIPDPFAVTLTMSQPVDDATVDSMSVTDQLTSTSPVKHRDLLLDCPRLK